ncbi:WXG100 family type VII secretion target [Candidatus Mycolicibacterium alkanivorans]|uniref:ESAT-6-like protein n=1 Tax=Candidatus Mycolicibacterium alkanivorans TaxID=2954114 RepID=A0ABS9Z097_9MYCO|nr:WXG100 family type VII secretion target [Candidatus Mycolicibacterium alkanivorans]MCI4676941.1 WXG100 family type VII secretion target [Candidatus Mycolicibacterium alkanivorans]
MDPILSYDFAEIDAAVLADIQATSTRLGAALDDLARQIAPLHQVWTREAASAFHAEQARWRQAATALHDILVRLGTAVRDGAVDVAEADRHAARLWG